MEYRFSAHQTEIRKSARLSVQKQRHWCFPGVADWDLGHDLTYLILSGCQAMISGNPKIRAMNAKWRAAQSLVFNCASFAAINARMSSDIFKSFSHCSLYNVTGKRPIP